VADSHATAGAQPGACSPSYTVAEARDPDRRRPSTHRQSARRPRGPRGCHPGGGARPGAAGPLFAGTVNLPPAGQSAARLPLYSTGRRRVASPVRGCHCRTLARRLLLLASIVPWPAAGPNLARRLLLLASTVPRPAAGPNLARRLPLLASTVPGPAAGPNSAQAAAPPRLHCARACGRARPGSGRTPHRLAGGPRPAPATVVAVTPAVRRPQTGRCGVLTRIPVGAAAVAGPGRSHSPAELAGPDPTTRHGDEAAGL